MDCSVGADGSAPVSASTFLRARVSEKGIHVVIVPVAVSASLLGLSASRLWKAASTEEAWDALTFSLFSLAVLLGLFTHFREDDRSKGARAHAHACEDPFFSNPLEAVEQPDDNDPPASPVPEDKEEVPEEEVLAPSVTPLVTLSPDPIPMEEVHVPPPSPPREMIKAKMPKKVRFANEIATVRIFHPVDDTEAMEQQQIQHRQPPPPPFPATSAGRHRKDSMGSSNAITVYLASPPTHKVVRLQQKSPHYQQQHQEEEDEVNSKAEAFIARFREQLRMQ